MSLRASIKTTLEQAEAAGDELTASTLRLALCAVRDRDRDALARDDVSGCCEAGIANVITTMIRQREASSRDYDEKGRADLAEQKRAELAVLKSVLPKPLAEDEIRTAAATVVKDLAATGLKDMGRCVTELKSRYPGRVDPTRAGMVVKDALATPE